MKIRKLNVLFKRTIVNNFNKSYFNVKKSFLLYLLFAITSLGFSHASYANARLNLKDTDIQVFIESVSRITGKTFIIDPRVKNKKVTVISQHEMNEKETFALFLSVLHINQFTAVETSKNVYKIQQLQTAKQDKVPVYGDSRQGYSGDQLITRVVKVDNIDVGQLVPLLRTLVSTQGHMGQYKPTNVLVIHDTAGNVERIVKIIRQVDRESNEEIQVLPLQYASATEVVRILETLEKSSGGAAKGVQAKKTRFVADERTNSILLSADKKNSLRLRALIAQLDSKIQNSGNTKVIYLKYAKAEDLATLLEGAGESIEQESGEAKPQRRGGNQKNYSIKAHAETNSLVITAAPDLMRSFESVINQLDIRRKQVNVEAIIVEISETKNKQLGIQWATKAGLVNFSNSSASIATIGGAAAANRGNGGEEIIGDNGEPIRVVRDEGDNGAALAQALSGATGLLLGFTDDKSWAGLVQALASDTDSNVLSRPNLTTMDNEEANISVGQEVPVLGGATFGSNNSNPFQSVERKDVGIKLKITPQVNEGNAIKLTIEQEVSSIAGTTATDIITNKRQITTTVLANDGQTVVLGGLIDEDVQESAQKVPLLGDLPLIGSLFSSKSTTKVKRNLMVFLRAKIIDDPSGYDEITSRKYNYIRSKQLDRQQRGIALMPDAESTVLPEWDETLALPPTFEETIKDHNLESIDQSINQAPPPIEETTSQLPAEVLEAIDAAKSE